MAARKKATETMAYTDVVIELVDARLPEASANPMIETLRRHRQRPGLKVLNKADLADPAVTREWLDWYQKQPGMSAVALSCKTNTDVARIIKLCSQLAPHRGTTVKPLRMMIMGIPNVGKSTLMNALLKKRVAKVGDEPAVTKSQQRLELNDHMVLVDTPGLMWPRIDWPEDALMLAASHAIGRNAIIDEEVATFLAGILLERYPQTLGQRYGFDAGQMDASGVIEGIAQQRNFRAKGGELDYDKAAATLLQDYRSGRLGRISLETPSSRAAKTQDYAHARLVQQEADKTDAGDTLMQSAPDDREQPE